MAKPFQFKEFSLSQEKAAMKVGTDAILLGAWCAIPPTIDSVLDIGTGTGIIALMIAQRSNATTIDAVEVDPDAFEQATENFEKSDWNDRLFCYHSPFEDFANEMTLEEEKYDFIISNPPFYTDALETNTDARNKARFTSSLSFEALISGVAKLLSENGSFSLIIPYKEEKHFTDLAFKEHLFLNRLCRVKGNENSETKRSLLTFSFSKSPLEKTAMIIETERHQYTQEYIDLTKDFYLKM